MSKIKFIRFMFRDYYPEPLVDIVYKSRRCITLGESELPKTAKAFLKGAHSRCRFDDIWGFEVICTRKEATP